MSESRPHDRPKISLEQLLKLKRSERPDPAFWDEFDRELRRRQLASVVAAPSWRARLARSLLVGLRRAVPVTAAGAAAIAGFMVLQPAASSNAPEAALENVAVKADESTALAVVAHAPVPVPETMAGETAAPEPAEPAFVPPATSAPRFVVHEFAAASTPSRAYVSVTSPNTFSSPASAASLQTVNTLSSGYAQRVTVNPAASNF